MRTKRTPNWSLLLPTATWVNHRSLSSSIHFGKSYFSCCVVTKKRIQVSNVFLCLRLPGFSLDSGKSLTKKGQLTVVAGAPRANHSGAVVLLKKGGDTSNILLEEYTLQGEGLASSFGYDLAVLDLNGDG